MELSEEFWVGVVETLGAQQRFERIIIAICRAALLFFAMRVDFVCVGSNVILITSQ